MRAAIRSTVLLLVLAGCRSAPESWNAPTGTLTGGPAMRLGDDYYEIPVNRQTGGPATRAERKEAIAKATYDCRSRVQRLVILPTEQYRTPSISAIVYRCVPDPSVKPLPRDPHAGPAGTEVPSN